MKVRDHGRKTRNHAIIKQLRKVYMAGIDLDNENISNLPPSDQREFHDVPSFLAAGDLSQVIVRLDLSRQNENQFLSVDEVKTLTEKLASKHSPLFLSLHLAAMDVSQDHINIFVKSLESKYFPACLELGFSTNHNTLLPENLAAFLQTILTSKAIEFAAIDLQHNTLGVAGMSAIASSVKNPFFMNLCQINLVGCDVGGDDGLQILAEALKSSHYPKAIGLQFGNAVNNTEGGMGCTDLGAERLANAMLENTSIIQLDISDISVNKTAAKHIEIIRLCVLRNMFLHKYPHLQNFIKASCAHAGLYQGLRSTGSLKSLAGTVFQANIDKHIQNLPEEIKEYLSVLNEMQSKFTVKFSPVFK